MAEYRHISHGFEPVFDGRSRILVLGSFPSVLSRRNDFYYGNPKNRFWKVLAACCDELRVPETVLQKKALLLAHGIALWDVVESCDVAGSADASIRNVVPTRIERILDAAPVRTVFANGGTAHALYAKHLQPRCGLPATRLPSTSPANASYSLERLIDCWREALRPAIKPAADPPSTIRPQTPGQASSWWSERRTAAGQTSGRWSGQPTERAMRNGKRTESRKG